MGRGPRSTKRRTSTELNSSWLREDTAPIEVGVLQQKLEDSAGRRPAGAAKEATEPIPVAHLKGMLDQSRADLPTLSDDVEAPGAGGDQPEPAEREEDSLLIVVALEDDEPQAAEPQAAEPQAAEQQAAAQEAALQQEPTTPFPAPAPAPVPAPVPASPPAVAAEADGPQVVAIDFGNTRCRVAAMIDGKLMLLPLPDGELEMPALVGFDPNGNAVVGMDAQSMLTEDPTNVVVAPRRLLGRRFKDRAIAGLLAELPMPSAESSDAEVVLRIRGRRYTLTQVCATLLYRLRQVAELHLGHEVNEAVLTVPVEFDSRRVRALATAAKMAGLRVPHLVEEPVAAALANRGDAGLHDLVGIYDFGGATFDFSVVDLREQIRVVASATDPWLGGNDFEEVLAGAAADDFWRQHRIELRNQVVQWQRLLLNAEQAKRQLSAQRRTILSLPAMAHSSRGPLDMEFPISQLEFSQLSVDLIERSLETCHAALEERGIGPADLSSIYLSSGTSHIPAVQQAVKRFFGQPPRRGVPPERAVLMGAAIYTVCLRAERAETA